MTRKRKTILPLAAACLLAGCVDLDIPEPTETVVIGAILPRSGGLSAQGDAAFAALNLAVNDINAFLITRGSQRRLQLTVKDDRSNAAAALTALRELDDAGASIVIGPFGADALTRCIGFADRVGQVLLSPTSTSGDLANDDSAFRLIPDAAQAAAAMAELLASDDREIVIAFADQRGGTDAWLDALATAFVDRGGALATRIRYDDDTMASGNFRDELALLSAAVADAIEDFGTSGVAVQLVSFDEGVRVLRQAADDPVLASVAWYAADGMALSVDLLADSPAVAMARTVNFTAVTFDPTTAPRYPEVAPRIATALGRPADPQAVVAYDALWLAALTLEESTDAADMAFFKTALPQVAPFYNGASGVLHIDANGDRTEGGFGFYTLSAGDVAEWIQRAP